MKQIPVTGMSCQSCAQTIQEAVADLQGARDVRVSFALKQIQFGGISPDEVIKVLRDLGYDSPGLSQSVFQAPEVEKSAREEISQARRPFLMAVVFGGLELALAMGGMRFSQMAPAWIQFVLTTLTVFGAGVMIHRRALKQVLKGQLTMDTLVSLGSMAAWLESVLLWKRGSANPGFETASTIVLFILTGHYLEARARRGTFSATAELFKTFQQAVVRLTTNGEENVTGLELHPGDKIRLKPGDLCPADGKILSGTASWNEASVTGEPLPRTTGPGDSVVSGAILMESPVTILVERTGEQCFMGRLLSELEKAQSQPVKSQRLADRITAYFVPGVILTAGLASLIQFFVQDNPELAFNVFLSVLLVACPCALGLAIPTALVAGLGASARRGILFRDAAVFEATALIREIYLDKTGTLTLGQPRVVRTEVMGLWSEKEILRWVGALESHSSHPLAKALSITAQDSMNRTAVENTRVIPGMGISGTVQGHEIRVTRSNAGDGDSSSEFTVSEIFVDGKLSARIFFSDELRPETKGALEELKRRSLKLHLLTGDRAGPVKRLGLDSLLDEVRVELKPEDKKHWVEEARQKNPNGVAFVGDGINDVLALSAASVGFAVASGAPAALGAASVSLTGGIADVPLALTLASKTQKQIKFNLFWALAYNAVMLPWAVVRSLSPMWAAFAMSASSVTVVLGSLTLSYRLRRTT